MLAGHVLPTSGDSAEQHAVYAALIGIGVSCRVEAALPDCVDNRISGGSILRGWNGACVLHWSRVVHGCYGLIEAGIPCGPGPQIEPDSCGSHACQHNSPHAQPREFPPFAWYRFKVVRSFAFHTSPKASCAHCSRGVGAEPLRKRLTRAGEASAPVLAGHPPQDRRQGQPSPR